MTELTDEEKEFMLWGHKGAAFVDRLGGPTAPKDTARAGADALMAAVAERYESRTERLLVLTAVSRAAGSARDDLLREIIEARLPLPLQPNETSSLASLSGVSALTIRRLEERLRKERAKEETSS